MLLGWWWWQLHPSTSPLQQGLILTQVRTLGGRGKSPSLICYISAISKGRGSFAGHFSLGNFQVTWFEGHRISHRVKDAKGLFYRRVFVKYFPGILFSDRHSKAGYIKESLVLLVARRLVGNTAASDIASRVWTQSLQHHLSCLSSGNGISSDSCWKLLFSTFKK